MYVTHTVHLLPKALDTKSIFSPSIFLNLRNNVKALSLPLSLSRLSTAAVAQEKGAAAAFHHQPSSSQTDEKKSDDGFYKVTSGQINQTWKEQNLLEVTFVGKELRSSFAKQLIILLRQIAKWRLESRNINRSQGRHYTKCGMGVYLQKDEKSLRFCHIQLATSPLSIGSKSSLNDQATLPPSLPIWLSLSAASSLRTSARAATIPTAANGLGFLIGSTSNTSCTLFHSRTNVSECPLQLRSKNSEADGSNATAKQLTFKGQKQPPLEGRKVEQGKDRTWDDKNMDQNRKICNDAKIYKDQYPVLIFFVS
jgi:hypothetical protein